MLGGQQIFESTASVERPELAVAADRAVVHEDLGHRPAPCQVQQPLSKLRIVTDADLLRPHDGLRTDAYRMAVGHIGLEAVLRLFLEGDENARAFHALTRFLDLLDDVEGVLPAQPALDPLVVSFQLKLLWLAG